MFAEREDVNPENVLMLADYTRAQVEHLLTVAPEDFYRGWLPWQPAPGESVDQRLERQRLLFSGQWREALDVDGSMYFFNSGTGETTRDVPDEIWASPRRRVALAAHLSTVDQPDLLPDHSSKRESLPSGDN